MTSKRHFTFLFLVFFPLLFLTSCGGSDEDDEQPIENKIQPVTSTDCVPIIAHRGCWGGTDFPQNSLAAFREALTLNIYGTEFDVRQTRDGRLVINHDATFNGLTIADTNYADLCAYTLSNGETIPLLDDFAKIYATTDTRVLMVVELKACNVKSVLTLLEQYDILAHCLFISSSRSYCNQLVGAGYGNITAYLGGNIVPKAIQGYGYAGINYSSAKYNEKLDWIQESKSLGLWTGVWTVNDANAIRNYLSEGVIVTTDKAKTYIEKINNNKL